MRALRNRLVRFAALGSLVFAYLGVNAPPAAAFASTGTVTIEGVYYYSFSDYYGTPYATLYIYSWLCSDTWAGTTTTAKGAGASCWLSLSGSTSGYARFELSGTYAMSGGSDRYYLRLHGGPAATWYAGPGTATGTARASYGYYEGPATANYTLTMLSDCSTWDIFNGCYPGYYWSQGEVTLTLDYVVQ